MFEVVFSKRAKLQLKQITAYVEQKFGKKTAKRTLSLIKEFEQRVSIYPEIHPVFDQTTQTRRAVLKGRMLAFYQVHETQIIVTALLTSYQDYSGEDVS